MAQAQDAQTTSPGEAKPAKSGKRKLVWILVIIASMVAGAATPMAVGTHNLFGASPTKKDSEPATVPFGEVTVNLNDSRMTRYLRIKIVLLTNSDDVKEVTKQLERHKAVLKNWLIGYLSGKSLKDVGGTVGVKRILREMQERFEETFYPNGDGKPFEVLFEEFVVQ